jgi:NAD(P)-dependent dehydrogenase (short-subunit alcohol dehydrogenase family)
VSSNQLAVVTGGSRGLGFETAKALRALNFDLVIIGKDAVRLQTAQSELEKIPSPNSALTSYTCDLENPTEISSLIEKIRNNHKTPDVLMLAHGVMSAKMSKTLKTDLAEWRRVMSINLDSNFQLINSLAPAMVEARKGRVIIFSACLGRMSGPGNAGGLAPYRISKAGVNALVRNLAHETGLGSRGFLIDAICPNHSRTDMGGPDAPLSAEEGARTAIWLATRPFNPLGETDQEKTTGVLWEENQVIPW